MKFLKKIGSPKDFEINNLSIVQPICQYFHSINIIKSFQKSFLNLWKIYRISMEWFPSSLPPAHLPEKRKRKKFRILKVCAIPYTLNFLLWLLLLMRNQGYKSWLYHSYENLFAKSCQLGPFSYAYCTKKVRLISLIFLAFVTCLVNYFVNYRICFLRGKQFTSEDKDKISYIDDLNFANL